MLLIFARTRHVFRLALLAGIVFVLGALGDLTGQGGGQAEAEAGTLGQWSSPMAWPNTAIHTTLLPNGTVLTYSYPAEGTGSEVWVWHPADNTFSESPIASNIFCSGQALLPDGTFVSVGGTAKPPPDLAFWRGNKEINRFNPTTETWSLGGMMAKARWYPTATELADGRILVISGQDEDTSLVPQLEIYDPEGGTSQMPSSADIRVPLYPWQYLLPSGSVFTAGPQGESDRLDFSDNAWHYVDSTSFGERDQGTSVLLPLTAPGYNPEVMIIGGGWPDGSTSTERIDLGAGSPTWQNTGSMNHPRRHANSVLLPTGRVLVTGGTGSDNDPALAAYAAEMYDPETDSWTDMASMQRPRMYHSTAVLLPDGRVLTAGTDGELTAEIYSPPYLFAGARPTIDSAPVSVGWGSSFQVSTPDAESVSRVVLMKPGTVTHSVNMGQRAVELSFTAGSGVLDVTAPPNGGVAPPGHYMMFLMNSSGVPSVASWVHVSGSPPATPTPTPSPTPSPTPTPIPSPTPSPSPTLLPSNDNDGDGYTNGAEAVIGTQADVACGTEWPANLNNQGMSWNKLDILDVISFVAPIRRLDVSDPNPAYSARWDLRPGVNPPFSKEINISDITALMNGPTGWPPMFGGTRAFGQSCSSSP